MLTIGFSGAQVSAANTVRLPEPEADLSNINSAMDCLEATKNPEMIASLEKTVGAWCKQVEQVLSLILTRVHVSLQNIMSL